MATLNAAQHFHLDYEIGSLSPGRWVDMILTKEIESIQPIHVIQKGRWVVKNGEYQPETMRKAYPDWLHQTVKIRHGKKSDNFSIPDKLRKVTVNVIELIPDQIINRWITTTLPVKHGLIQTDIAKDILKLAVVERYGKNGNIGIGFVKGFGLKKGAISSSVAHDHHNIVIAGVDDQSIATCVCATEAMQVGLVVTDGEQVISSMPLPLGGLMSEQPFADIIRDLDRLNYFANQLGCPLATPFMTLSFISLPTVPDLGLTDLGLIDVKNTP
jgi:adenine deaminase